MNIQHYFILNTLILVVLQIQVTVSQDDGPIVETAKGFVQGRTITMHYGETSKYQAYVNSFWGIPFGKPPIGELRFEKPVENDPWGGIFNATTLGGLPTACMQSSAVGVGEDCLNLNVYTPLDMEPDVPYPVMVYFYGGAYTFGDNTLYPGHFYAARDVVAVVINYRVGIFGFMSTEPGDDIRLGNAGLYDQVLALEWVRDNIAAFGGNPNQVTIFGQSAGASSAGLHTVSPVAQGLFHAVIEQSGCDTTFWAVNMPEQEPWNYPKIVAEKVNCTTETTEEMVDCLRSVDARELERNQDFVCKDGYFCLGHAPVIDGPGGFLPDRPLRLRESGEYSKVPIMAGNNAEDGSLYVIAYIPEALLGGFNRSEFERLLYERYVTMWEASFTPQQAEDAYWAVNYYYTPWPHIEDEDLNRKAFVDMTTDAAFSFPIDRQLKLQSEVAPTYMYIFGYRSSNTTQGIWENTQWFGVPHAGELPYTFGWALLNNATEVREDARQGEFSVIDYNEIDEQYSEFIMDLFSNFAKYFDPTPEPIQAPNGHGPITLPALTQDELNYIWIHIDDVEARVNYRQKSMAFFRDYISYIIDREILKDDSDNIEGIERQKGLNTKVMESVMRKLTEGFMSHEDQDYEDIFNFEESAPYQYYDNYL